MNGPRNGHRMPYGVTWAADNGRFGKGWPGADVWFAWLARHADRAGTCRFAVAPDVPFDAVATLAESRPWLEHIRHLGYPAAFAAQDGSEEGHVPWGEFDVLFLRARRNGSSAPPPVTWPPKPAAGGWMSTWAG
ncbi:hypothetical protein ACWDSL_48680 [Streptomyces sp. NPDC000941]